MTPDAKDDSGRGSSEAEQGFRKAQVVGSSPTLGSIESNTMDLKKRYSRRARIETKRNIKKIAFYIVSAIVIILVLFFFGVNLLIKYAGFFMELNSSDTPIEIVDTTPLPPPNLRNYPRITNQEELVISGGTQSGARVKIAINNREEEVIANNEGQFTFIYKLNRGKNQFYAFAIDASGNQSANTETISIEFDNEPPELEIIKPENNAEFIGPENRQISIEGQTESGAQVNINGRWAVVDTNGKFNYTLSLEEGENNFTITAKDEADNETEVELTVSFTP